MWMNKCYGKNCFVLWCNPFYLCLQILQMNVSWNWIFCNWIHFGGLNLEFPLFFLFLVIYIVTAWGNLGLTTQLDWIHTFTPPCTFSSFTGSFIDLCYSSVITPKMLMNFISKKNTIYFRECMTQLFFSSLNVTCWHQWLMIAMWPYVIPFCITLPCPLKWVPMLCLFPTWWPFLVLCHVGCMLRLTCDANIFNH
jgi:olfactory receptor